MEVIEYDAAGNVHSASGKRIAETMSVVELFRLFPNEDVCYVWLEASRWNGRPVCPHCGGFKNISQLPSKPHSYRQKRLPQADSRHDRVVHARDQARLAELDLRHLHRRYGSQWRLGPATVYRAWHPVQHGMAHAAPGPRGLRSGRLHGQGNRRD